MTELRQAVETVQGYRRDLRRELQDVEDDLRRDLRKRLDELTLGNYDVVIRDMLDRLDKDKLNQAAQTEVNRLMSAEVQKVVKQALDESDLPTQIWESLDKDSLTGKLVDALLDGEFFRGWLKENASDIAAAIAEAIRDNDELDMDTLTEKVAEVLVDRIQFVREK